jgi:LysR family transcriptional regulator, transcription activator of glutamate synthase operon
MSDPWVLVVPSDGPLGRRRSANLGDLGDVRLLGANSCSSGLHAESVLAEHSIDVHYAFRSDDNGTLQGMAAAGFGVALMPLLAVSPGDDRVKVLRLEPDIPRREISVVWHRDRHRSPASRAFVELAVEVGADVERQLDEP